VSTGSSISGSSDTAGTTQTCGADGDINIPVMRLSNLVEMPVLAAGMAFLTVYTYNEEYERDIDIDTINININIKVKGANVDGRFRGFPPEYALLDAGWRHSL
jgi:hypothetical protein